MIAMLRLLCVDWQVWWVMRLMIWVFGGGYCASDLGYGYDLNVMWYVSVVIVLWYDWKHVYLLSISLRVLRWVTIDIYVHNAYLCLCDCDLTKASVHPKPKPKGGPSGSPTIFMYTGLVYIWLWNVHPKPKGGPLGSLIIHVRSEPKWVTGSPTECFSTHPMFMFFFSGKSKSNSVHDQRNPWLGQGHIPELPLRVIIMSYFESIYTTLYLKPYLIVLSCFEVFLDYFRDPAFYFILFIFNKLSLS